MSVRFRVLFSTACAVLAVMVCLNYAQHVQAEADRARSEVLARYGGEVVTLVVSSAALEPGDIATQSNVTTREWLVDLAPEGALTSLDEVLGKEVGNAAPKGVPLTDVTFRDASTMAEVPAGRVAVTVPVTDRLGVPRDISQGATLAAYEVSGERRPVSVPRHSSRLQCFLRTSRPFSRRVPPVTCGWSCLGRASPKTRKAWRTPPHQRK